MGLITDVGSGLQDEIDYIYLAGATGLHNRFGNLYTLVNGNLEVVNLKSTAVTGAGSKIALQEYPEFTKGIKVNSPGFSSNGRLSLSAGRLKLVGADGNDPSATNPVFFNVPSSTTGSWDTITFTSNTHCLIDDSSTADSYFRAGAGTPWGTTAGNVWNESMPFGIYVCTDGTTHTLFMARDVSLNRTPTTTYLGYKNVVPATADFSNCFFMSASNLTVSHQNVSCYLIAIVEMQKNSSDDWLFQTALAPDLGIGNFSRLKYAKYFMPIAQNGASSGSHFSVSAGTPPIYTTLDYLRYSAKLDGTHDIFFQFTNAAGGTAGAGAAALTLHMPVPIRANVAYGTFDLLNNANRTLGFCKVTSSASYSMTFLYQSTIATAVSTVAGVDQNNATRSIEGQITFF